MHVLSSATGYVRDKEKEINLSGVQWLWYDFNKI
jgi:hypothetical protein